MANSLRASDCFYTAKVLTGLFLVFTLQIESKDIFGLLSCGAGRDQRSPRSTEVITATGWGRQPGERCHVSDRHAEQE